MATIDRMSLDANVIVDVQSGIVFAIQKDSFHNNTPANPELICICILFISMRKLKLTGASVVYGVLELVALHLHLDFVHH